MAFGPKRSGPFEKIYYFPTDFTWNFLLCQEPGGQIRPENYPMSDQDDKYRRYAEAAQVQAEKAISVRDKESWLKIARSWLELLPTRLRTAEDQFNDKVRDLGIGQEESGSRN